MTVAADLVASPSFVRSLTVALAGNPNSGKTTLFNALTGLRQKVANYPGVTVEKKTGKCRLEDGRLIDVIDLPGAYSLISRSPDETIAMQVLRGLRPDTPAPDVVIVVLDASNLQRNLYLLSQIIELGRPMVVALNMSDIAKRRGLTIAASRLDATLGVPVIEIVAHRKQGIDDLKRAILHAAVATAPDFDMPTAMREEMAKIAASVERVWAETGPENVAGFATDGSKPATPNSKPEFPHEPRPLFVAERLLIGDTAPDLQRYHDHPAIKPALDAAHARLRELDIDPMQADIEAHYAWIERVARAASEEPAGNIPGTAAFHGIGLQPMPPAEQTEPAMPEHGLKTRVASQTASLRDVDPRQRPTFTDKIDRILLHRVWGTLTFAAIMASLFIAIFIFADPLMGMAEEAVAWVGEKIGVVLPEEGPIHDLWNDGIVAGVGGVLVFVPQIAMLFLFLAILEDSGYLARAAFLMDRLLGKLGLNGKSFIPLLSSHACAIPGIMATRTIENRQDRMATIFVAPFMSCSARLPVYALLIGTFFASYSSFVQGGILFACYSLGILAAVVTAVVFRKTFLKGASNSFVLELPSYKVPQIGQILRVMWTNTWAFVSRAGTIIFALSVILWAMAYYPRLDEASVEKITEPVMKFADAQWNPWMALAPNRSLLSTDEAQKYKQLADPFLEEGPQNQEQWHDYVKAKADEIAAAAQLEQSISGRLGHFIEPVIRPLGYDWKMGVGLIASFAAREVFVSQMGIVYAAGDAEEDAAPLEQAMAADTYADGSPVWTPAVAISLLVWFCLAMQCISTTAIVYRETGSWKWPVFQLVYMNMLAYVGAFIAFQIAVRTIG